MKWAGRGWVDYRCDEHNVVLGCRLLVNSCAAQDGGWEPGECNRLVVYAVDPEGAIGRLREALPSLTEVRHHEGRVAATVTWPLWEASGRTLSLGPRRQRRMVAFVFEWPQGGTLVLYYGFDGIPAHDVKDAVGRRHPVSPQSFGGEGDMLTDAMDLLAAPLGDWESAIDPTVLVRRLEYAAEIGEAVGAVEAAITQAFGPSGARRSTPAANEWRWQIVGPPGAALAHGLPEFRLRRTGPDRVVASWQHAVWYVADPLIGPGILSVVQALHDASGQATW